MEALGRLPGGSQWALYAGCRLCRGNPAQRNACGPVKSIACTSLPVEHLRRAEPRLDRTGDGGL